MSKNKNRSGVVYSTDSNFNYQENNKPSQQTFPPKMQKLFVKLDSKMRAGKTVTLIDGFIGSEDALEALCKLLKTKVGTGGSAKEGQIIIQGNQKDRVMIILKAEGYNMR